MPGPGEYLPDATEGITRPEDLPAPKVIKRSRDFRRQPWRLDRLGRTAKGLTALFDDLQCRHVGLVSLRDGLDLSTPAGRLMAHVLASVAQYETELRGERVRAGQAVARANGKRWGGSEKGRRLKVTPPQVRVIQQLKAEGEKIAAIARATGLSRPTVYSVLGGTI